MKPEKNRYRSFILLITLVLLASSFSNAVAAAPHITSLSAVTLARSGRLRIFGTAFGLDGQVLIGGLNAPVADWTTSSGMSGRRDPSMSANLANAIAPFANDGLTNVTNR